MQILNPKINYQLFWLLLISAFLTATVSAQTTAFNFQGRLNDGAVPANGNLEMQFKLFDAPSGGSQIGATILRPNVVVNNGIFTTQLDFGAAAFDGSARFVEIGVRPTGNTNPFTTLNPRQSILSTPYAIQAKNAAQLGGIAASEYVTTTTVGSSFIKNATTQQTGNFNISGGGVVGDSLGIGVTPSDGYKLDINGNQRLTIGGRTITFASPNGETGMSIIAGSGRADIRFDGTTLKLVAGAVGSVPPSTSGIAIRSDGNVGIGTINPGNKLDVVGSVNIGGNLFTNGTVFLSASHSPPNGNTALIVFDDASFLGNLFLSSLGAGGNTALCRNASNAIAACSSSLRYKTNIASFGFGLNVVNQLHPISFDWKQDGMKDVGFGAEDVAKINPLFVTYNPQGEVEGVKYDRLSVVFVNAFKEQQTQIEQQQKQIENLTKLICLDHPNSDLCRGK